MAKFCKQCGREKKRGHVCDLARLTDGRIVHNSRVEIGGDLHDQLSAERGGLKVAERTITPELREQLKKAGRL